MKKTPSFTTDEYHVQRTNAPDIAPPWHSPETWHEANRTVAYLIRLHGLRLGRFLKLCQGFEKRLERLSPALDALCANTCPWCPDPCCLSAVVWFDFADLLFLHSTGRQIPTSQPQEDSRIPCRYLGSRGCILPRLSRPWICTWYLCNSQLANLRKRSPGTHEVFSQALQAIKEGRKEMEGEFIRVVAKGRGEGSKGRREKELKG